MACAWRAAVSGCRSDRATRARIAPPSRADVMRLLRRDMSFRHDDASARRRRCEADVSMTKTDRAIVHDAPLPDERLEIIQRETFNYFWHETNPNNGLIPDNTLMR